jgi:hypothetical protein
MVDPPKDQGPHYGAEDARGAEINLRSRRRRLIFMAGLVGFVLFVIVIRLLSWS